MSCVSAATVTTILLLVLACILSCMQAPTIDLEFQTKVTEYTILYGSGDFANEATRPASDTFYEIQNIELFSTFQLKMTATNSRGTSEESGAVKKGKCVTIHSELVHENCLWYIRTYKNADCAVNPNPT